MWYLSFNEINETLRRLEEEHIRGIKSSEDYDDKKYHTTAVFLTRKIRNKLHRKMKNKYE